MTFKGLFSSLEAVLPYKGRVGYLNLNSMMTLKVHVIVTVFCQILNNTDPQLETDFQSCGFITITSLTSNPTLSFGHEGE